MQSQDHQEMLNNESHQQPPLQDRRLKSMTGGDSSQAASQQHPPQKCPRCESMNTKFCYYNNYSLSQPRYFCKTCRRYWTQGGTLRNVPVGGGCRKGKRSKTTSSSNTATSAATAASSSLSQAQPQQQQNMITSNPAASVSSMGMGQFYPGGDFLSSLAAAQPSNQQRGFSSGDLAGPSNLSLLQGYAALQFSQAFHQTQAQLFHFGNRDKGSSEMEDALYTSSPERLIQAGNSQTHQQNWLNQSLFSNPSAVSDGTNVWTIESTTAKNTSTTTAVTSSASMNPNQWPDLPGFGGRP